MSAMKDPADMLTQLNDDVLVKIFEEFRPDTGLCVLSSTCRWLREATSPILFRSCYQCLGETPQLQTTHEVLPSTLWPHVQTLELCCFCPAYSRIGDPTVVDPLVCVAFNTIHATLHALPRLTTLHLRVQAIDVHGTSWDTMRTILSLPHLRDLRVDGLYICPEPLGSDNLGDATVTPLSTLHYTMPQYRQPWSFPSEMAVLDFLVRKLHTSLESLRLPVESAPIQTISTLRWPRLREFTLQGERWSDLATPLVSLFSSMPLLRHLSLELSETEDVDETTIWPKGLDTTYPWPYLERLRVSHPDAADEIYAHLPSSVRRLALRSWPHHCAHLFEAMRVHLSTSRLEGWKRRWWTYPLSTPRNLVQILQKCTIPLLRGLELEYKGDTEEPQLLRLLIAKFPHLTMLEIHRIRSLGSKYSDVPVLVTELGEALAPLTSLRILKLHLDFADMPSATAGWGLGGDTSRIPPGSSSGFDASLAAAAAELSRSLAPSLEEIWMFKYDFDPLWVVFVVTRSIVDGESRTGVERKEYIRY